MTIEAGRFVGVCPRCRYQARFVRAVEVGERVHAICPKCETPFVVSVPAPPPPQPDLPSDVLARWRARLHLPHLP